jgi:aminopeptidase N
MAHQWFGDLVTMGWWDNLWLNEGFASWMQEKAAEHFYPQWHTWLNGYGQKQYAMTLDARRTSHPIQQRVADQSEATTAFDGITYNKGQALIRMLENYLGEEPFRAGIRGYMAAHGYGNTTTADLWQALEAAAGKPVKGIAVSFTEQDGVPLITAETACDGATQRLSLRQDRFVIAPEASGDGKPLAPRSWQIPVEIGPLRQSQPAQGLLLDANTEVAGGACGEPIKVNLGDIGYYRVEYGPYDLAALTQSLATMTPEDRVNLLADRWALVQAGRIGLASYLGLIDKINVDDRRAVWDQVIGAFTSLDRLARGRPERAALQAYARTRLRPLFDRLGWDAAGPGDGEEALLRGRLIQALGDLGDGDIVAEARRRFAEYVTNLQPLPAALRDPVIHVVGIHADRTNYDTLLGLARKTAVTTDRLRYYYAAASARDPDLAGASLALTLTDELPSTILNGVIHAVASSGEQPELAWDFIQKNLDALTKKQGPSFRDTFIPEFMTNFSDEAHAAELAHFGPALATTGGRVMVARSLETIAISADLKARALPALAAWIKSRDGAR